jgi:polyisoprenoid-binding protein YceI
MIRTVSIRVAVLLCWAVAGLASLTAQEAPAGATRIEIAEGSTAEYRVREQLARLDLPNDAIGRTTSVSGSFSIAGDGSIRPGGRLRVDLRDITSDADMRDNFIRRNTLETARYPYADFVPRRIEGLPALPASGPATFRLIGDMTIHGVTKELAWDVEATFAPDTVRGEASTRFPFATFDLTIPKVFGLLSVDDDIRLVLNITARRLD